MEPRHISTYKIECGKKIKKLVKNATRIIKTGLKDIGEKKFKYTRHI